MGEKVSKELSGCCCSARHQSSRELAGKDQKKTKGKDSGVSLRAANSWDFQGGEAGGFVEVEAMDSDAFLAPAEAPPPPQPTPQEVAERKMKEAAEVGLKEFARIQQVIKGIARKKAVSNKLFGGAKDRYFAAVPGPPIEKSSDAVREWKRWREGVLAYWETQNEFEKKLQPKGSVPLLHVTKVVQSKTDVHVLCEDPKSHAASSLDLSFDSANRAAEWNKAMSSLHSAVRSIAQ